MASRVETHYTRSGSLANRIAEALRVAGKDLQRLQTNDLSPVDEFHVRGRKATLELAAKMNLDDRSRVLDIGSGLGGPARTLAQTYGCHVTGIDLTASFCEAASELSRWAGLADKVDFLRADATAIPFADESFDAAMSIHAAMNIDRKDLVYGEAVRVLKLGGIFAVYDILKGEGGEVLLPAPWAREPSISFLATPQEMRELLEEAGFEILEEIDSTDQGVAWFKEMTARMAAAGAQPLSIGILLGPDFQQMAQNQLRNLADRRIRTVSFICKT
jgi:ubiquinone/menaquinone biosynthesis C-methylase UbiE